MTNKSLVIKRLPELDNMPIECVGTFMRNHLTANAIDCVNWPNSYPYKPDTKFILTYSNKYLYIYFETCGYDLRAENKANLSPVADDSCVEFFMQIPNHKEYWNFEFNCIGTVNSSHRVTRDKPTRLNSNEINSIKRFSSCGDLPFEEKKGIHTWALTVAIPFDLFEISANNFPKYILGNFYKCAGKTEHVHFLSWAPIDTATPCFHEPRFFAPIYFQ